VVLSGRLAGPLRESDFGWTFQTAVPELVRRSPEGTAVQVGERFEAEFSGPIDAPLLAGSVQVLREGQPETLTDLRFEAETNALSFALQGGLRPGSRYQVVFSGLLAGPLRAVSEGDFTWAFQTVVPELVRRSPEGAAAQVQERLEAAFSAAIDTSLLAGSAQVLREGEPQTLEDLRFDMATNVLSFGIEEGLKPGSRYEVTLSGLLAGPRRAVSGGDFTWTFQTPVPALASTSPASGDSEVSTAEATLRAVFDNPIDADLLQEPDNVVILKSGQQIALADLEYNAETRTVRLVVSEGLRGGTPYQVRLSSALGGPLRQGDYAWSFSTQVPLLTGTVPQDGASGVDISLEEATVRFSASIDAQQRLPDNFVLLREGLPLVLRQGDPVDRGAGVYGLAPAAGWQVGSRYALQIAPAVSGPLGPGQTQVASFQTAVPGIVSTRPAHGDTAVSPRLANIALIFDNAIDEESLRASGNVLLFQEGRSVEIGEPAYNPENRTVTLTPAQGLRGGTPYQVRLSSVLGGPLRQDDYTWSFSTRVPAIASADPGEGASLAAGPRRLQVRFSGPVDPDLITSQNFRLSRSGLPLSLPAEEFTYDAENFTVGFPTVELLSGSQYRAEVSARASGPLALEIGLTDFAWSFRTQIPQVVSTRPADGEDGVSVSAPTIQVLFSGRVARQEPADFQLFARDLADTGAAFALVRLTGFGADTSGAQISFAPEGGLRPFSEYRVVVDRLVLGELAESGFSWTFQTAASLADAGAGGLVSNADRSVELYIPPSALGRGAREILIRRLPEAEAAAKPAHDAALARVTAAFAITAGDGALKKPATLTMRYTADELDLHDPTHLAIFRLEGSEWQRLGGTPEPQNRLVRTAVKELGTFAVFEDLATQVGALAIQELDCQPRAFAPRGGGLREETDISFTLTGPADVTVRVYNSSGRLERVIVRDRPMAAGRVLLKWDGQDEDRKIVASGLYIVVVSAGEEQEEKTVAVVR
jgi:hypothetical protein